MFVTSRAVDKCTTNDDTPTSAFSYAEVMDVCKKDPAYGAQIVKHIVNKLKQKNVIVRLKALKLLKHLQENQAIGVPAEIRNYITPISEQISWKSDPHPTLMFQPYEELHDVAQFIVDQAFAQPVNATPFLSQAGGENYHHTKARSTYKRVAKIAQMEAVGNTEIVEQRPSLEPRDLRKEYYAQQAANNAGASTNKASGQSLLDDMVKVFAGEDGEEDQGETVIDPKKTLQMNLFVEPQDTIAPNTSQPVAAVVPEKKRDSTESAAAKLLRVTGGRALPTNGELKQFSAACSPKNIEELLEGAKNEDWKVKVRALHGLEIAGQKFGFGTVCSIKDDIEDCLDAPQASLRTVAERFYDKIKNAKPTDVHSAFKFVASTNATSPTDQNTDDFVIDFTK